MENLMGIIESYLDIGINFINSILWGYVLIYLLIGVGVYFYN